MVLNLQKKQSIVNEIKKIIKDTESVIIADFRGVTANQITELRQSGNKSDIYIYIARNTLIKYAIKDSIHERLQNHLNGPTLIACSKKHPGIAARLLQEFINKNSNLKIKAASFDGDIIPSHKIDFLAKIPTYEENIIKLILIMKEISIGKFIRILYQLSNKKTNI